MNCRILFIVIFIRFFMKQIVGQLSALMLITVLVTSVAATPAFADWDKTKYPAIQGTIPIEDGQDFRELSNISLVEAMSTAEEAVPDSKAIYGKLSVINGYLVYKVVMMDDNSCLLYTSPSPRD